MDKKLALSVMALFFMTACAIPIKHDPTAFMVDTGPKESIPPVCKSAYESAKIKVAVVNFTNNSTFDYASVVQTNIQGAGERTTVGGAAVGVIPGAAGIVWGEKEKTKFQQEAQTTQRQINAKLSESVEDGVMDELVNMGGATVYTRKDMEKIMTEHKFQRSGLVDEATLARLGKLAGIKYIVTGSINNVNLSYKTYESARKGLEKGESFAAKLIGSAMAAGMETQEGWHMNTDVAVRIIDVETGEVLFSKVVGGKHIIGKIPYPNYDAIIGGVKKAAAKGLEDIRPQLSRWFTVKGYIVQTRSSADGKQRSALINIGEKQGLKMGSELFVYTFQEIADPFDERKISCDIVKLPVTLKVTEQLQADKAWVMIEGKPDCIQRVKVGQLVERKAIEGQSLLKKMGY
ncbi:MAG: CsgG/HfaB family protein [Syntrophales bacterium]|nr:CsgG/HfaB family protein [Syntrophales bacterium]